MGIGVVIFYLFVHLVVLVLLLDVQNGLTVQADSWLPRHLSPIIRSSTGESHIGPLSKNYTVSVI